MSPRTGMRTALLVAAAALLAHAGLTAGGVWSFEALNYDDPQVLEILESRSAADLLTGPTWYAYKPVYFLSLKIDSLFGSSTVAVGHVVNWLLHALAAFLLVRLLLDGFGSRWIAGAVGLLFAVHPVHAENVAWLSERKDMLSLVFVLWAHLAWRKRRARGGEAVWLPCLLLVLGGLTKGTVWSYAGVLLIDELLALRALEGEARRVARRRAWQRLIPVGVVAVAGVGLDAWMAFQLGAGGVEHGVSTPSLAAAMAGVHLRYLLSLLVPAHLTLDYAVDPAGSWAAPLAWGGVLLALGAVYAVIAGVRRGHAVAAFAAGFWVFGLAPVNNVWPRTAVLMADRYLYVPAIGLYLVLAWLVGRSGRARAWVLGTAVVALAVLCEVRTATFRDSERVWTDAIEKVPGSALARIQRGHHAASNERYGAALEDAEAAIELRPRPELLVRAHLLRCAALLGRGEGAALLEAANRAATLARGLRLDEMVRDDPGAVQAQAEIFRGQALERIGEPRAALAAYRQAVALDDANWSAHFNYGTLLAAARTEESLDEAIIELRRALDLNPRYLETALNLATVFARKGDKPRALAVLGQAEERHGRVPDLLYARATIELEVGNDWAKARTILRELRELDPDHPKGTRLEADISVAVGRALLAKGRDRRDRDLLRSAVGHFDEALQVRADHWEAHLLAGDALAEQGRYGESRRRYRKAREIATTQRWIEGVMARTAALQAAEVARRAETMEHITRAARIFAGAVSLDVDRIDLGFTPLQEELALLRDVAAVLEKGRQPEADRAASLLAATALLVTGDEMTALRDLEAVFERMGSIEREPVLVDAALLLRAILYARQTEFERARDDYRMLAKRRPDDLLPLLRSLQIDLRAAEARRQIAAGFPNEPTRLAQANETLRAMADRVRSFADRHPESSSAGLLAVTAEIGLERWIEALRRLNAMEERFPELPSVYRGFNAVYVAWYTKTRDRSHIEGASRALKKAMTLDQRDVRTLMDASQLARVAGDLNSALKHARRARELESYVGGPASRLLGDLHVELGRKALEGGQVQDVRRAITAARRVDPTRAGSWILEGELALKSASADRFKVAYDLARKAKELEPYDPDVNRLLARCHRGSATSALLRMGSYRPPRKGEQGWASWRALGEAERQEREAAYAKMREHYRQRAIAELEQALLLDPASEDADDVRKQIERLRRAGKANEFERYQSARAAYERGRALADAGRKVDALYAYREAVELRPRHPRYQYHVLVTALQLLVGLPTDHPDGRKTADKYVEYAFRALDALDNLDVRHRFPARSYYRGLLNAWIYASDTSVEARTVARQAAIRAFEYFLLTAKSRGGEPEDDPMVAHARAKLRTLREAD